MRNRLAWSYTLLALAACAAISACDPEKRNDAGVASALIEGQYRVVFLQQAEGKPREVGRARVTIPPDWFVKERPSGSWEKLASPSGESPAMLSGASTLVPMSEDRLAWSLHPYTNDHNLQMQVLSASGEEFSGTWTFSTIAGPRDRGEFRATRER